MTSARADPAYIVVDAGTGAVLDSQQADQPWYPASLTKLMTAYVTFRALDDGRISMGSTITVSPHALAQAPSKMGLKVGTVMDVDNALKMMLVKSANDIAMAVAESVGGSEPRFVSLMNAEARRLGMASTHYHNPNGLPDDQQITTARDLAVLARAILTDFPDEAEYFRIPAIQFGKHVLRSQNKLLERYRSAIGMKTGFVCSSGFNIVAAARRNGRTIIAVVLGGTSSDARNELAARLLDRGFARLSVGKPALSSFDAAASTGNPPDLRPLVCGKGGSDNEEEAADDSPSALGPRFVLMAPVPVYIGNAGPAVYRLAAAKVPASEIPLPRLRPSAAVAAAGSDPEQGDAR